MSEQQNTLTLQGAKGLTVVKTIGFAVVLAAAAHVAIPLPGTPVPFTLQPMLVVMAGFWLAPRAAVASMVLYLLAGALGLPVWAPIGLPGAARLIGPTGGYLLSYPVAAWVVAMLARRATRYPARVLAAIVGMAVIYAGGLAQLTILTGSLATGVLLGVAPFAALDLAKSLIAAALVPRSASPAP
ncbi:MAG: biotin transporter BioY [Gemmatimonadaceae bacterium]